MSKVKRSTMECKSNVVADKSEIVNNSITDRISQANHLLSRLSVIVCALDDKVTDLIGSQSTNKVDCEEEKCVGSIMNRLETTLDKCNVRCSTMEDILANF